MAGTGINVAIIATDMFEEAELTEPRKALEAAGIGTTLIAPHDGDLQAANHDEKSGTVTVDTTLDAASPTDYDAVLLPGGALNADNLRIDKQAQAFVRAIDEAGKPLAAICHAPWLLISAGLVSGRHLTSFPTLADDLRNAGAEWSDEEAVRDDNWVTSRKPDDIPAFNAAFMKLLTEASGTEN